MTDTLKPAELDLEALKADAKDCANRLRGKYAIGPIMANGEPEFGWQQHSGLPITQRKGDGFPPIYGEAASTIEALLTRIEALEAERDEARAGLAYVLDRAVYGNSYGVYGSDFQSCHFCQGGGAPGVAMEHDADCPVSRYPRAVADWFEEMEAERQDREAAEAQRDRMREALERAVAWFRDYARQHRLKGTQDGMLKADTNDERADYCEAALSHPAGRAALEQPQ
jgi:hypothetical protein